MVAHLRMHHSGLSYLADLEPNDVKSLVLLTSRDGNVADIVPIYKTRVIPKACTSIEDVQRMLKEGEELSVIIEIV